jgi:hypothetical protein
MSTRDEYREEEQEERESIDARVEKLSDAAVGEKYYTIEAARLIIRELRVLSLMIERLADEISRGAEDI